MDWTTYERRASLVRQQVYDGGLADYCLDCALRDAETGDGTEYEHDGLWLYHRRIDYSRQWAERNVQRIGDMDYAGGGNPESIVMREDRDASFWERLGEDLDVLLRISTTKRNTLQVARMLAEGFRPYEIAGSLGITRTAVTRAIDVLQAVLVC